MKVIGVVGGVGAGKSYVAQAFARLGAVVIDADRVGHDVLELETVRAELRAVFGPEIFSAQGRVDRRALARRVFSPGEQGAEWLRRLEAITHPEIERRLRRRLVELAQQGTAAVVLDAAIMIRTGWHRLCDVLVFVDADQTTRAARAAQRGWSDEEWRTRESRQLPLDEMRRHCSDVVFNGGQNAPSVDQQALSLWKRWQIP